MKGLNLNEFQQSSVPKWMRIMKQLNHICLVVSLKIRLYSWCDGNPVTSTQYKPPIAQTCRCRIGLCMAVIAISFSVMCWKTLYQASPPVDLACHTQRVQNDTDTINGELISLKYTGVNHKRTTVSSVQTACSYNATAASIPWTGPLSWELSLRVRSTSNGASSNML